MGIVQVPDALRHVIDRQVAEGRAASEAEFLAEAVRRYAAALERDSDAIVAAADEGVADMEAGRFVTIASADDMRRLDLELGASLDALAQRNASAKG